MASSGGWTVRGGGRVVSVELVQQYPLRSRRQGSRQDWRAGRLNVYWKPNAELDEPPYCGDGGWGSKMNRRTLLKALFAAIVSPRLQSKVAHPEVLQKTDDTIMLRFTTPVLLKHSDSLILPLGGENIPATDGDVAIFVCDDKWAKNPIFRCIAFERKAP